MRDPLDTVLKLRRTGVDTARRALAESLATAALAQAAVREEEQAIAREMERASDPDGGDELVEALAAWLPGARQRTAKARQHQERQEAEIARLRAELAACRTALESVEQLVAERRARVLEVEAARERLVLDEAASRLTRPR